MRQMLALLLALLILPGALSAQERDGVHLLDLPILVAYCERDPGNRIHPGGGRWDPQQQMEIFGCTPAAGIDVTVSNLDIDFFDRCTTDGDGMCRIEAPTDPERELMVAVHMSTVTPGHAPADVVVPTVHYTEFTGVGIPLFLVPEITPGGTDQMPERTTIAVNVARCEDGSFAPGCEREPVQVLVQASSGDITAEGEPWLATNDEGWVSFDREFYDGDGIDLMLVTDGEPRFACSEIASGDRLATDWIEGREGTFIRVDTTGIDGDIACDVTLP